MMILRRVLFCPLAVLVAVLCQLTLVNRAPLPGGGGVPDVVLLVVAALGVVVGPTTGMLAGFAGGLAMDVAPPGGHLAGEYALVYCLVGYACGRVRDIAQGSSAERSAVASLTVMAVGVAAGEAGKVALGLMLSDPNMTGPAIRHVLPAALVYDLLLCPFVLWLVSLAVRAPAFERAPKPEFAQVASAFRAASAGAVPKLRLAGSTPVPPPLPVRSELRLRFADSPSALSRTTGAYSRPVQVDFTSGGRGNQLGGASALRAPVARQGAQPAKGWLRANGAATPARTAKSPGKGWLSGTQSVTPIAWTGKSPGKGWLRATAFVPAHAWAGSSPGKGWLRVGTPIAPVTWTGRSPGKGWLRGAAFAPAPTWAGKSPGRGWLRTGSPVAEVTWTGRSPGRGWLRAGSSAAGHTRQPGSPGKGWLRPPRPAPAPRRKQPGRGWLRQPRPASSPRPRSPGRHWIRPSKPARRNWYTAAPSTGWLRRGRRRRRPLLGGRR
jgi:rod shape-determining protein MreD